MGIPTYFRVITQQYKGIIHQTKPVDCDHYFVDFNGIVHQSAQRILSVHKERETQTQTTTTTYEPYQEALETSIMAETCSYLNKCISVAGPRKMVHTCADGVAPIAKMNQQRKRRYLSVLRNKIIAQQQSSVNAANANHLTWDTNAISPGTRFMSHLDVYMRKHVRENPQKTMHFISGADECGEGEHKIFSRMGMLSDNETAFIYGLDADLIMLSLMSHNQHIYLMREAQHVVSKSVPKSATTSKTNTYDSDLDFVYLDIHALRVALLRELLNVHTWPIDEKTVADPYSDDAKDVIESYVTICFILGNDFIPHTSTLSLKKNGHNKLLSAAKNAWEVCGHGPVVSGRIQSKFLSILLQVLCKNEDAEMLAINEEYLHKKAYYNPDSNEPEALQCYALQPGNKDRLAQMMYSTASKQMSVSLSPSVQANTQVRQKVGAWRGIYYKMLFNCKLHDTQTITTACDLFITGIYWTYCYYKRLPKDAEWYYPFNYAPTLLDMSNYLNTTIDMFDEIHSKWKHSLQQSSTSLSATTSTDKHTPGFVAPHVQLLSILPKESVSLLPRQYQQFMTHPKFGCTHMFPTTYPVQTYLKTHLWECTPILPVLDTSWIISCDAAMKGKT